VVVIEQVEPTVAVVLSQMIRPWIFITGKLPGRLRRGPDSTPLHIAIASRSQENSAQVDIYTYMGI
jgi:hypothetical protein